MQFLCFKPERSSLRFQFRHRPNNHPKKMLGFARFLPASSDVFPSTWSSVVRFDVVSKDFLKSIGTCRKEARETKHFLRMIVRAVPELKPQARTLWLEAKELHLIFSKIWRNK